MVMTIKYNQNELDVLGDNGLACKMNSAVLSQKPDSLDR